MMTPPPAPHAATELHVNPIHRPHYHFLPAANWMNDPNGVIHWQGMYHMFYQYNPHGAVWGAPYWGHATSTDLVHWQDEPIALAPEAGSYDEQGCWSGCTVDNNGVPTIIYTGVGNGRQRPCLATSTDGLHTWQKYAHNPIIAEPPDLDLLGSGEKVDFRDHCIWREQGMWRQIIGSGIRDVGGVALLFESPDLIHWTYLHPLCVGDLHQKEPVWTGILWECPELRFFGDRHALILSVHDGTTNSTVALVGRYQHDHFTPELTQKVDYGNNYFYAPQSLIDEQGRIVMWGWLQEGRSTEAQQADGWSGVMSLPRVVTLNPDGTLCLTPAPELAALRKNQQSLAPQLISTTTRVEQVRGDALELHVQIDPASAQRCGIAVRCSDDESERTLIVYDRETGQIGIDATHASMQLADNDARFGPLTLTDGELLDLRIFVDSSVIEVFANGRACCTGRVYPARPDSLGVQLIAEGGEAQLVAFDAWEMKSIWDERRSGASL